METERPTGRREFYFQTNGADPDLLKGTLDSKFGEGNYELKMVDADRWMLRSRKSLSKAEENDLRQQIRTGSARKLHKRKVPSLEATAQAMTAFRRGAKMAEQRSPQTAVVSSGWQRFFSKFGLRNAESPGENVH